MTSRNIALTVFLVAALVLAPAGALAATAGGAVPGPAQQTDANNSTAVAPGQMLSGVVDVQRAAVEGDVEARAFGLQVARAATDNATADVVAERLGAIEQRLDRLQERTQTLEQARENGSMSEGEYRARVAGVVARTQTAERLANQTAEVSQGLPTAILEAKGINVTAIQTLQERAGDLRGPEVAAIARDIAGGGVDVSIPGGPLGVGGDGGPADGDNATTDGAPGGQGPADRPGQNRAGKLPVDTPDDGLTATDSDATVTTETTTTLSLTTTALPTTTDDLLKTTDVPLTTTDVPLTNETDL